MLLFVGFSAGDGSCGLLALTSRSPVLGGLFLETSGWNGRSSSKRASYISLVEMTGGSHR